jgi:hypothetical protein
MADKSNAKLTPMSPCGEVLPNFKSTRRYKIADRLSETFWIDIIFDVATMILFSIATIKVFSILIGLKGNL